MNKKKYTNELLLLAMLIIAMGFLYFAIPDKSTIIVAIATTLLLGLLIFGLETITPLVYIWLKLTIPITVIASKFFSRLLYLVVISLGFVLRLVKYLEFNAPKTRYQEKQEKYAKSYFDEEY